MAFSSVTGSVPLMRVKTSELPDDVVAFVRAVDREIGAESFNLKCRRQIAALGAGEHLESVDRPRG